MEVLVLLSRGIHLAVQGRKNLARGALKSARKSKGYSASTDAGAGVKLAGWNRANLVLYTRQQRSSDGIRGEYEEETDDTSGGHGNSKSQLVQDDVDEQSTTGRSRSWNSRAGTGQLLCNPTSLEIIGVLNLADKQTMLSTARISQAMRF